MRLGGTPARRAASSANSSSNVWRVSLSHVDTSTASASSTCISSQYIPCVRTCQAFRPGCIPLGHRSHRVPSLISHKPHSRHFPLSSRGICPGTQNSQRSTNSLADLLPSVAQEMHETPPASQFGCHPGSQGRHNSPSAEYLETQVLHFVRSSFPPLPGQQRLHCAPISLTHPPSTQDAFTQCASRVHSGCSSSIGCVGCKSPKQKVSVMSLHNMQSNRSAVGMLPGGQTAFGSGSGSGSGSGLVGSYSRKNPGIFASPE